MSDMTIEKAREIVLRGNPPFVNDRFEFMRAVGFIDGHSAGHASRDPEVAELKAEIKSLIETFNRTVDDQNAEREASKKLVEAARKVEWHPHLTTCPCRDDWRKDCTCGKEDLEEALKPYIDATPGHSPEGKTL